MDNKHLADCLTVLKSFDANSGEWIMKRAEIIADVRLKERTREIMARTSLTSPHFWRGMSLGLSAMFNVLDKNNFRKKQQEAISEWRGSNGSNQSFDWAFENLRLAMIEYINQRAVDPNIFSEEQKNYLFPDAEEQNNCFQSPKTE